ncbi:MAG: hypothetical protein AAGJ73_12090 [Pseudomonadota bacterium]
MANDEKNGGDSAGSGLIARLVAPLRRRFARPSADAAGPPPDHRATLLPLSFESAAPRDHASLNTTMSGDGGRYGHGRDLPSMLQTSARRNSDRISELGNLANGVKRTLIARASADTSQVAGMLRLFIAAAWIAVAIYFHQARTSALIDGAGVTKSGMSVADASTIASTFFTLGGAGGLAAIALLMLVIARAISLKADIQSKSQNFGLRVAQMLKDYDARLKDHRDALADKARSDDSVAAEVSEAHVTAQEAMLLYEDVSFLADARAADSDEQMRGAVDTYRDYLSGSGGGAAGAVSAAWTEGLGLGALIGALAGGGFGFSLLLNVSGYSAAEVLERLDFEIISGFEQYPGLLFAIVGGATAFLLAGVLAGALSNLAFAPDRRDRLRESLNEIRGAVTGENAPRAADIARRVEDLSEIFRVRLMGRPIGQALSGDAPATAPGGRAVSASQTDDVPHWRRPKEGARFVETAFEAAPRTWRTDAYAQYAAKNSGRAPEAKRSLLGFKKGPRD